MSIARVFRDALFAACADDRERTVPPALAARLTAAGRSLAGQPLAASAPTDPTGPEPAALADPEQAVPADVAEAFTRARRIRDLGERAAALVRLAPHSRASTWTRS